jgi:hypothetical protein
MAVSSSHLVQIGSFFIPLDSVCWEDIFILSPWLNHHNLGSFAFSLLLYRYFLQSCTYHIISMVSLLYSRTKFGCTFCLCQKRTETQNTDITKQSKGSESGAEMILGRSLRSKFSWHPLDEVLDTGMSIVRSRSGIFVASPWDSRSGLSFRWFTLVKRLPIVCDCRPAVLRAPLRQKIVMSRRRYCAFSSEAAM